MYNLHDCASRACVNLPTIGGTHIDQQSTWERVRISSRCRYITWSAWDNKTMAGGGNWAILVITSCSPSYRRRREGSKYHWAERENTRLMETNTQVNIVIDNARCSVKHRRELFRGRGEAQCTQQRRANMWFRSQILVTLFACQTYLQLDTETWRVYKTPVTCEFSQRTKEMRVSIKS